MSAIVDAKSLAPATAGTRYRVGVWVLIAGIAMFFTALTSAYIVRAASAPDWHPMQLPHVIWLSSFLILISSGTMQAAVRSLKQQRNPQYVRWLSLTAALGFGFLASQWFTWKQLSRQGVYLATTPNSSFFYLLTAAHGMHLMVGLLALLYLLLRTRYTRSDELAEATRVARAGAVGIYWHFMDGLWIYLFLLLFLWRSQ